MSARSSFNFPNPLTQVPINVNVGGDTVLVLGLPNKQIKVFRLKLITAMAVTLLFKDGATVIDGPLSFSSNEGMVLDFPGYDSPPWYTTSFGNSLILNCSSAVQVGGNLDYLQS
jgi:hypothetical protein